LDRISGSNLAPLTGKKHITGSAPISKVREADMLAPLHGKIK